MTDEQPRSIAVRGANEHNLRSVDVDLPRGALTVVTGVSGSGKSSLAFDTIFREGQRRYLAALSSHARRFLGKLHRPQADHFAGLPPALAVDQRTTIRNPRSTVGTLTEILDHLRLLFSRAGEPRLHLGAFSFNTKDGACPTCDGLAVVDHVDRELLIADPSRTLRQGALVPTTKTGYIVYSQVTVDVLNDICQAHGFDVDTPWQDLTAEQHDVIFFGSQKLKVPFGKHPLESRMKWKGITARPRDEGYYKGLIPTIEETLTRNRNDNVLRFVRSVPCEDCAGTRLNAAAREVRVGLTTLPELLDVPLDSLSDRLEPIVEAAPAIATPIAAAIRERLELLLELGLGYLTLDRESTSLSGGEAQRIRLASQVGSGLHGLLYVLDEPSIGLHPSDTDRLLGVLRRLRDLGNTILCVEHDPDTIAAADHLVDLGPGAGTEGGRVLFDGPAADASASPTQQWITRRQAEPLQSQGRDNGMRLVVRGASAHNLTGFDVAFHLGALNVVTGVSGAGKSTLVDHVLARALRRELHGAKDAPGEHAGIDGLEHVHKVIHIDAAPIGRTPRSNPATYTGALDHIRDLFADQPAARAAELAKGSFSMNVKGGRCEECQGAGRLVVGMHGLADVDVRCPTCHGRRFGDAVLAVRYREHSIADVLALPIRDAFALFADVEPIARTLRTLDALGLGYVHLGQAATTLSGGEAQRIKLATELARPASRGHTVYILDEPTTGLHGRDVDVLLAALDRLVDQGQTVIVIEHDQDFVRRADHVIDLGPGAGAAGGRVVFAGPPDALARCAESATGRALQAPARIEPTPPPPPLTTMEWRGVGTNNLKDIDVSIPLRKLTVITGVSGSGKSSLAFDTIFAEGQRRFAENLTTQTRRALPSQSAARFESAHGLTPAVAIRQRRAASGGRSTVGTMTEIHDYLRILWSRAGTPRGAFTASMFSFHHPEGACATCEGAGVETKCDPDKLITDEELSLFDGAMDGTKTGKYYGERDGRYLATLTAVGSAHGIDFDRPWIELDARAQELAMFGTGEQEYSVTWHFKRGKRSGEHAFEGTFDGFARYVDEEYARKKHDRRGDAIRPLLTDRPCPDCAGARLRPEVRGVQFAGKTLHDVCGLPARDALEFFRTASDHVTPDEAAIAAQPIAEVVRRLRFLTELGVDHLALDRDADSLSGGEGQRVRLATQLGTRMTGVTYVLDEPTVGLHPHDTDRLITCLQKLRDDDGTVVVVEHDPQVWAAADHVIALGPGAGRAGGEIVAAGDPATVPPPSVEPLPPRPVPPRRLRVVGASAHNLRDIDVELPMAGLTAVTGVSGSGKSTLVRDVIVASRRGRGAVDCREISNEGRIAGIVYGDARGVANSPATMPVTHLGVFDAIRKLFAKTERAVALGLKPAAFSLATKSKQGAGRCEVCQGHGAIRTDMDFLADVWHRCAACDGRRFSATTLECTWQDKTIADVLAMTVDEAVGFFAGESKIRPAIDAMQRLGLGYLTLGQPGNTLSGGEAQRVELARALIAKSKGPMLFVLDEPTTGLHADDVSRLLPVLRELTELDHTVIVVEHNMDVVRSCDWVVDLGPGSGDDGGTLVYCGPPAGIGAARASRTAPFL